LLIAARDFNLVEVQHGRFPFLRYPIESVREMNKARSSPKLRRWRTKG
jgi:hypothetical protein